MIEFEQFKKIPRLNRDCTVSEKIDGTNAQIVIPEEADPLLAGSRNRWITPEADNFGFARWVAENASALRDTLGPGRFYGEWWGPGIQRGYGLARRRFSLFNPKWRAVIETRRAQGLPVPEDLDVVPVLYEGPFLTREVEAALFELRLHGSHASPGFMRPEGVVIFHHAGGYYFKSTIENDEKPKGGDR